MSQGVRRSIEAGNGPQLTASEEMVTLVPKPQELNSAVSSN